MKMNKLEFVVDDKNYYVRIPNQRDMNKADLVYKTKYSEALRFGALTAAEAQKIIDERKIFGPEDEAAVRALFIELHGLGEKLLKTEKFTAAAEIIFKMEEVRGNIMRINMRKNNILDNTAESYADEHRLQFYAVACSFTEDGQSIFKDTDEYLERATESVAKVALTKIIHLIANDGKDFRSEWPEYQWRIQHGLMDEQLNLNQEKLDEVLKEASDEISKVASSATKNVTVKKRATKKKVVPQN
jgi:hypothetical protein